MSPRGSQASSVDWLIRKASLAGRPGEHPIGGPRRRTWWRRRRPRRRRSRHSRSSQRPASTSLGGQRLGREPGRSSVTGLPVSSKSRAKTPRAFPCPLPPQLTAKPAGDIDLRRASREPVEKELIDSELVAERPAVAVEPPGHHLTVVAAVHVGGRPDRRRSCRRDRKARADKSCWGGVDVLTWKFPPSGVPSGVEPGGPSIGSWPSSIHTATKPPLASLVTEDAAWLFVVVAFSGEGGVQGHGQRVEATAQDLAVAAGELGPGHDELAVLSDGDASSEPVMLGLDALTKELRKLQLAGGRGESERCEYEHREPGVGFTGPS